MERTNLGVLRSVRIGGTTKQALLAELQACGVQLNAIARIIFAHQAFATSGVPAVIETMELSVGDLGHTEGATIAEVFGSAAKRGLSLCPLELAPHLRLQSWNSRKDIGGTRPRSIERPLRRRTTPATSRAGGGSRLLSTKWSLESAHRSAMNILAVEVDFGGVKSQLRVEAGVRCFSRRGLRNPGVYRAANRRALGLAGGQCCNRKDATDHQRTDKTASHARGADGSGHRRIGQVRVVRVIHIYLRYASGSAT
jgi:hypothetical protein